MQRIILHIDARRNVAEASSLLYGHFLEHFHRQIYGGIYDPKHPLADEDGFRTDILEAMRRIRIPVLRWPGGCFVSAYHWQDGVGKKRTPCFDKAWRVEEPNTFGTDEFIKLCRKIGSEPYICTNAGTGTIEEMSDWVEYCNLVHDGKFSRIRIANGFSAPHGVKYWSIGNENYGFWELGAKRIGEWGALVREAAKLMKHVDPKIEISAAALPDVDWTFDLLKQSGQYLDWISVHQYWDMVPEVNLLADYDACMAFTDKIDAPIKKTRGILTALGLENKIKIAFDEWNLRSWHHPNVHTIIQGEAPGNYLLPRDKNDDNTSYTMADAVFAACFLNAMLRNADIVGMANFAPVLNTRGCIYSDARGIVLRSTYYVFDLYANTMGNRVVDSWSENCPVISVKNKSGEYVQTEAIDCTVSVRNDGTLTVAAINKDKTKPAEIWLDCRQREGAFSVHTVNGKHENEYNDHAHCGIQCIDGPIEKYQNEIRLILAPHSVNVVEIWTNNAKGKL